MIKYFFVVGRYNMKYYPPPTQNKPILTTKTKHIVE